MLLSKHAKKHVDVIIKHCVDNGMSLESTMGLHNHLVRIMNRLDKYEGRTAEALESAPTDKQQAKGKNYPKVKLKHYPTVTCPKCLQFYSNCRCG